MSCTYRGHPSSLARREEKRLGTVRVVIAMASTMALRVSSAVAMVKPAGDDAAQIPHANLANLNLAGCEFP